MNPPDIFQAALRALCWFDIFDFPLTAEELFRHAWIPPAVGYFEFKTALSALAPQKIGEKFGYYFLPGREDVVESRRQRTIFADQKLQKARRAVRWARLVPFVRGIFACNSVAFETASKTSDIDWFIITRPGRIWLVRFFTNLILKLTGQRVGRLHAANKICLSFYVDSDHLNLDALRVAPDDGYLAYWLHSFWPLYDPENLHAKILSANAWARKYLPNRLAGEFFGAVGGGGRRWWQRAWEAMWQGAYGDLIEKQVKEIQLIKMKPSLKAKAKLPASGVVIAEGVIKLHENDTRRAVREKWLERIKNIELRMKNKYSKDQFFNVQ